MKAYFLLFLAFPTIGISQIKADGFFVSLNNDTVEVTFKIPKKPVNEVSDLFGKQIDFLAIKEGVEIIDSAGEMRQLLPSASKGFLFRHGSRVYNLFSKPIDNHNRGFLRAEIMGERLKLLYYIIEHPKRKTSTGAFGSTSQNTQEEYFWTFEKQDGTFLFLRSTMQESEMGRLLKNYLGDSPKMHDLIDRKFQPYSFGEVPKRIKSIVEAYNAS